VTERRSDFGMTSQNGQSGPAKHGAGRRSAANPPGRHTQWRALGLAVAAHSVLFGMLFFGVAWKTTDDCKNGIPTKPGYFEAMWDSVRVVFGYPPKPRKECMVSLEMWSPTASTGGSRTVPTRAPTPEPEPEPAKPMPAPVLPPPPPAIPVSVPPQPAPAPPPPKPVAPPTPRIPEELKPPPKPDLALEREKAAREKLQREKTEREKAEREKAEREKAEREKIDRAKAEKEKAERLKAEKDKAERAEKERQDRALKEKLDREKAEREKAERAEREKAEREKAERAEREKAEREKLEQERLERDRAERDRAERDRAERDRAERAKAEREAAEQRRQRDFARDIARSQAEAGEGARPSSGGSSSGASGGGGSSNRIAEWQVRVKSAIRENTTFVAPPDMTGNPQVVFRVTLSPDCALIRVDRINSSGVPSWDQAAERAVRKTNPFPRFPSGQCPPSAELTSRPYD